MGSTVAIDDSEHVSFKGTLTSAKASRPWRSSSGVLGVLRFRHLTCFLAYPSQWPECCPSRNWEGEAPAEPFGRGLDRLGRSLALPSLWQRGSQYPSNSRAPRSIKIPAS